MTGRTRWPSLPLALAAFVLLGALAVPKAALAVDPEIPGAPLTASPVAVPPLDWAAPATASTVYSLSLVQGETLVLNLYPGAGATGDLDLDLYLYGPGTTSAVHTSAIAKAELPLYYPETISYTAHATGQYYVETFAYRGSGAATLTWSILPEPLLPVYRFYNLRSGTHFYTPSDAERNTVIAQWSSTYRYEGIAYETKATKNEQPLYRFFNLKNGSHFYTASATERDKVRATWPNIYRYEGETYRVSLSPAGGKAPIYRFYNTRMGSHFYTISPQERETVIANWPGLYNYEGVAFYVGR